MTLTDTQKNEVTRWIAAGLKLAEIQKRLQTEFGVNVTYMEVRLLVDDLKLIPKDVDPPKPPADLAAPSVPQPPPQAQPPGRPGQPSPSPGPVPAEEPSPFQPADAEAPTGGNVSIHLDQIARPGALVSGSVQFSDGQTATWYLDQMGRLGLAAAQKGYRPSQADLEEFQIGLERVLARAGI